MTGMQLKVGAQARAAVDVAAAQEPLQTLLTDLAMSVQGAAAGFTGAAAGAFYDAVGVWLEAAADLLPLLDEYGRSLVATDVLAARTDGAQSAGYGLLAARLGGTP